MTPTPPHAPTIRDKSLLAAVETTGEGDRLFPLLFLPLGWGCPHLRAEPPACVRATQTRGKSHMTASDGPASGRPRLSLLRPHRGASSLQAAEDLQTRTGEMKQRQGLLCGGTRGEL